MKTTRTCVSFLSASLAAAAAAMPQSGSEDAPAPAGPVDPRVDTRGDSTLGPVQASGNGAYSANLTRSDVRLDTDLEKYLNRLNRITGASAGAWSIQDPLSPFGADFPLFGFVQPQTSIGPLALDALRPIPWQTGTPLLAGGAGEAPWSAGGVVPDVYELIRPRAGWSRPGGVAYDRLRAGGLTASQPAWPEAAGALSWPWATRPTLYGAVRPSQVIPPLTQWLPGAAGADAPAHDLELHGLTGMDLRPGFESSGTVPLPLPVTGRLDLQLTGEAGAFDSRWAPESGVWDQPPPLDAFPSASQRAFRAAPGGGFPIPSQNLTSADLILADAAMTRGDFETAERIYRRILLLDGSNAAARFNRAMALFANGSYDEAAVEIYSAFQAKGGTLPTIRLRSVMIDPMLLEQRRQALNTLIGQYTTCERLLLHAYVEASCGRVQTALDDLKRAGAMEPKVLEHPAVKAWREALERRSVSE